MKRTRTVKWLLAAIGWLAIVGGARAQAQTPAQTSVVVLHSLPASCTAQRWPLIYVDTGANAGFYNCNPATQQYSAGGGGPTTSTAIVAALNTTPVSTTALLPALIPVATNTILGGVICDGTTINCGSGGVIQVEPSLGLTSLTTTTSVKTPLLNNVHYANQWCTTPGTLDDTCFSNAIADIVANGPVDTILVHHMGTIVVPPGVYTFSHEVTLPYGTNIAIHGTEQSGVLGSIIQAGTALTGGAFDVVADNVEMDHLVFINTGATSMPAILLAGRDTTQPHGVFDAHINWNWFAWNNNAIHVANGGGLDLSHNTFDSGTAYGISSDHASGDTAANDILADDLRGYAGTTEVLIYGDNTSNYQALHFSGIFDNGTGVVAIDLRNVNNASVSGTFNSNKTNDINLNGDVATSIGPINTYATGSTSIVDTGSTSTHIFSCNFVNPNATDASNTHPTISITNDTGVIVSGCSSSIYGGTALASYGLSLGTGNVQADLYGNNFQAQVTAPYQLLSGAFFPVEGILIATGSGSAGQNSAVYVSYPGAVSYGWDDTAAGTDEKIWDMFASGATGQMQARAVNDSGSSANNWLTVNRSGYVPTSIIFGAPVTAPQYAGTVVTLSGASPAINAAHRDFTITLSANATATVSGIVAGTDVNAQICQPASGGPYTFAWPAGMHGGMTIGTTASTCSMQTFHSFNGTTLVAMGTGAINVAP